MQERFFSEKESFGPEQNFAIAVGFNTAGDFAKLDPKMGSVKFESYERGIDENGQYAEEKKEIPNHICSDQELGLLGESAFFKPISTSVKSWVESFRGYFFCIEKEDTRINGTFDSESARMITATLRRAPCLTQYCKDKQTEYFRGSYLNLLSNEIRWDDQKRGSESIV